MIGTQSDSILNFFTGGKNEKLDEISRSLGLWSDNIEFLDFLQPGICKRKLVSNKLKTHVKTGNIYYDNQDTNKSIFYFFLKQQDQIKEIIDYEFLYSGDYVYIFFWLIDGLNRYQNTQLDILTCKNSKYLF